MNAKREAKSEEDSAKTELFKPKHAALKEYLDPNSSGKDIVLKHDVAVAIQELCPERIEDVKAQLATLEGNLDGLPKVSSSLNC